MVYKDCDGEEIKELIIITTVLNFIYFSTPLVLAYKLYRGFVSIERVSFIYFYFRLINPMFSISNDIPCMHQKQFNGVNTFRFAINIIALLENIFFIYYITYKKISKLKNFIISFGTCVAICIAVLIIPLIFTIKDEKIYHNFYVVTDYIISIIFPFECFTTGENTLKFIRKRNPFYMSILVAFMGLCVVISWIVKDAKEYDDKDRTSYVVGFIFDGVALVENIVLIILFFKFKSDMSQKYDVEIEDLSTEELRDSKRCYELPGLD